MPQSQRIDHRLPDEIDVRAADTLREILASKIGDDGESVAPITVMSESGEAGEIVLTPTIAKTLLDVLRLISSGKGFQLIPYAAELTTQEAADFLNVSRPYLIKLLEAGDIHHTKVGRHRRVRSNDLFKYMDQRDSERADALGDLAAKDAELGLI